MTDLSQFETVEHIPFAIMHPTTQEALGPIVHVRSSSHEEVRKATRAALDHRMQKEARGKTMTVVEIERYNVKALVAMVARIDWNGMTIDNKEPPAQPDEEFMGMMRKRFMWFTRQIEEFSADEARFFQDSTAT